MACLRSWYALVLMGALVATLTACGPAATSPEEAASEGVAADGKLDGPICGGEVCYDRCNFDLYADSGCDAASHCELRLVGGVEAEVCVAGPWTTGLLVSDDGMAVLGLDPEEPTRAEPYRSLASTTCGGSFGRIPVRLFGGLANTLLAAGREGRSLRWERLCSAPSDLPDRHGIRDEAAAGQAFRLVGYRLKVVGWVGLALYGAKTAVDPARRGPLWSSRVMVYANHAAGRYYLYADGADDRPGHDPERGRHFGEVDGVPWLPLDGTLAPDVDYRLMKADQPPSFTRQWGDARTIAYLAGLAWGHVERHGWPLGIGDVSLPTGGDIDDHSSHEVGRDADFYLLSFPGGDRDSPVLWVSDCSYSSSWRCWYYDNATGAREQEPTGEHCAAEQLRALAEHVLVNSGVSHFVQNDVVVLAPFRDRTTNGWPRYVDASNASAMGWPLHGNHVHLRFTW